jgi:hypothetical protein
MKKSKIFMAAGTVVLALTAIFATKANKRFTSISTAYFAAGGGDYYIYNKGGTDYLTANLTSGSQLNLRLSTKSGTAQFSGALITKNHTLGSDHVYYK